MKQTSLHIYGKHAVLAALANKERKIVRVWLTAAARSDLDEAATRAIKDVRVVDTKKLDSLVPPGSVHQGVVLEVMALEQPGLEEWLAGETGQAVLLLDQVSDPHNIGAILRSAAAFNVGAVVATDRHAPSETGVMAKAACGAMDNVPLIAVTNLVQAMEILKKYGYWTYGLDGHAKEFIADVKFDSKTALILGAEGEGMRQLTAKHCDFLIKLPMSDQMESLNVSNAAAVALYDIFRRNV